jgi:hypothetical protein
MEEAESKRPGLASGWILVTGLLLLCFIGTGLTWWNYTRHVFSSARGVVLDPSGGNNQPILIRVEFPVREARTIQIGHGAIITIGKETRALKGRVISVNPGHHGDMAVVTLRLIDEPSKPGQPPFAMPPAGAPCGVTIDTTVPPLDELKQSPGTISP